MSDIVKKGSLIPSLDMPNLPQLFSKLQPVETPELTFDKGLISGWFHEKKLARMERVSEHEANIARNRASVTENTASSIITALTFGKRYETVIMRYDNEQTLMVLAVKKEEALVAQEVYKAKTMEIEYNEAKFSYEQRCKEYQNDNENENRE